MSAVSSRLAKKIETKRKWEAQLKPYEQPVKYFRSVLYWDRPIDFGVLITAITVILWFIISSAMSVITMVSLSVVTYFSSTWLANNLNVRFPWSSLVDPSSNPNHFDEVLELFVSIKFAVVEAIENCQRFRATNPARFVLQVTIAGLVVAYLGSWISGLTLFLMLVYSLLLLPGTLANDVPGKVFPLIEPYIGTFLKLAKDQYDAVLVAARRRMATPAVESGATIINNSNIPTTTKPIDEPAAVTENSGHGKSD